jgi:hypothetical protein
MNNFVTYSANFGLQKYTHFLELQMFLLIL